MTQKSWTLIYSGKTSPSPQWRMKSHRHDHPELIVIIGGILRVKEPDGKLHTGKAGDVFVYPAECWHEEESDKKDPVETIFFSFNGATGGNIKSIDDCEGRIRALSRWIWNSRQDEYARTKEINQVFFEAIGEEFVRQEHLPKTKSLFDAVRTFTLENIERTFGLDELAAKVNMSKFHFVREYKKKTGQSPMADVRKIRIEDAKNLIGGTNLPLKAIAAMVGINNEYQLAAAVKKYTGFAAGHFRRK